MMSSKAGLGSRPSTSVLLYIDELFHRSVKQECASVPMTPMEVVLIIDALECPLSRSVDELAAYFTNLQKALAATTAAAASESAEGVPDVPSRPPQDADSSSFSSTRICVPLMDPSALVIFLNSFASNHRVTTKIITEAQAEKASSRMLSLVTKPFGSSSSGNGGVGLRQLVLSFSSGYTTVVPLNQGQPGASTSLSHGVSYLTASLPAFTPPHNSSPRRPSQWPPKAIRQLAAASGLPIRESSFDCAGVALPSSPVNPSSPTRAVASLSLNSASGRLILEMDPPTARVCFGLGPSLLLLRYSVMRRLLLLVEANWPSDEERQGSPLRVRDGKQLTTVSAVAEGAVKAFPWQRCPKEMDTVTNNSSSTKLAAIPSAAAAAAAVAGRQMHVSAFPVLLRALITMSRAHAWGLSLLHCSVIAAHISGNRGIAEDKAASEAGLSLTADAEREGCEWVTFSVVPLCDTADPASASASAGRGRKDSDAGSASPIAVSELSLVLASRYPCVRELQGGERQAALKDLASLASFGPGPSSGVSDKLDAQTHVLRLLLPDVCLSAKAAPSTLLTPQNVAVGQAVRISPLPSLQEACRRYEWWDAPSAPRLQMMADRVGIIVSVSGRELEKWRVGVCVDTHETDGAPAQILDALPLDCLAPVAAKGKTSADKAEQKRRRKAKRENERAKAERVAEKERVLEREKEREAEKERATAKLAEEQQKTLLRQQRRAERDARLKKEAEAREKAEAEEQDRSHLSTVFGLQEKPRDTADTDETVVIHNSPRPSPPHVSADATEAAATCARIELKEVSVAVVGEVIKDALLNASAVPSAQLQKGASRPLYRPLPEGSPESPERDATQLTPQPSTSARLAAIIAALPQPLPVPLEVPDRRRRRPKMAKAIDEDDRERRQIADSLAISGTTLTGGRPRSGSAGTQASRGVRLASTAQAMTEAEAAADAAAAAAPPFDSHVFSLSTALSEAAPLFAPIPDARASTRSSNVSIGEGEGEGDEDDLEVEGAVGELIPRGLASPRFELGVYDAGHLPALSPYRAESPSLTKPASPTTVELAPKLKLGVEVKINPPLSPRAAASLAAAISASTDAAASEVPIAPTLAPGYSWLRDPARALQLASISASLDADANGGGTNTQPAGRPPYPVVKADTNTTLRTSVLATAGITVTHYSNAKASSSNSRSATGKRRGLVYLPYALDTNTSDSVGMGVRDVGGVGAMVVAAGGRSARTAAGLVVDSAAARQVSTEVDGAVDANNESPRPRSPRSPRGRYTPSDALMLESGYHSQDPLASDGLGGTEGELYRYYLEHAGSFDADDRGEGDDAYPQQGLMMAGIDASSYASALTAPIVAPEHAVIVNPPQFYPPLDAPTRTELANSSSRSSYASYVLAAANPPSINNGAALDAASSAVRGEGGAPPVSGEGLMSFFGLPRGHLRRNVNATAGNSATFGLGRASLVSLAEQYPMTKVGLVAAKGRSPSVLLVSTPDVNWRNPVDDADADADVSADVEGATNVLERGVPSGSLHQPATARSPKARGGSKTRVLTDEVSPDATAGRRKLALSASLRDFNLSPDATPNLTPNISMARLGLGFQVEAPVLSPGDKVAVPPMTPLDTGHFMVKGVKAQASLRNSASPDSRAGPVKASTFAAATDKKADVDALLAEAQLPSNAAAALIGRPAGQTQNDRIAAAVRDRSAAAATATTTAITSREVEVEPADQTARQQHDRLFRILEQQQQQQQEVQQPDDFDPRVESADYANYLDLAMAMGASPSNSALANGAGEAQQGFAFDLDEIAGNTRRANFAAHTAFIESSGAAEASISRAASPTQSLKPDERAALSAMFTRLPSQPDDPVADPVMIQRNRERFVQDRARAARDAQRDDEKRRRREALLGTGRPAKSVLAGALVRLQQEQQEQLEVEADESEFADAPTSRPLSPTPRPVSSGSRRKETASERRTRQQRELAEQQQLQREQEEQQRRLQQDIESQEAFHAGSSPRERILTIVLPGDTRDAARTEFAPVAVPSKLQRISYRSLQLDDAEASLAWDAEFEREPHIRKSAATSSFHTVDSTTSTHINTVATLSPREAGANLLANVDATERQRRKDLLSKSFLDLGEGEEGQDPLVTTVIAAKSNLPYATLVVRPFSPHEGSSADGLGQNNFDGLDDRGHVNQVVLKPASPPSSPSSINRGLGHAYFVNNAAPLVSSAIRNPALREGTADGIDLVLSEQDRREREYRARLERRNQAQNVLLNTALEKDLRESRREEKRRAAEAANTAPDPLPPAGSGASL